MQAWAPLGTGWWEDVFLKKLGEAMLAFNGVIPNLWKNGVKFPFFY